MREQVMKLEKVRKSCRSAKIVARILSIITGIGAAACLIGGAILYFLKDTINPIIAEEMKNGSMIVSNQFHMRGMIEFTFNLDKCFEEGLYAEGLAITCIIGFIICLFATLIFRMIAQTFVRLQMSESPFDPSIMTLLKKVFITLTLATAIVTGLGNALMIGLVLWCIYCIMDYGCALQEEVDDTI